MAKLGKIMHNEFRKLLVEKFSARRAELKKVLMSKQSSIEEKFMASSAFNKLPRNSAKARVRNRCFLTGRPRGYRGEVGLSRISFREYASRGLIPGMAKSSW